MNSHSTDRCAGSSPWSDLVLDGQTAAAHESLNGRFCCKSRPAPSFKFGVLPRIEFLVLISFLRGIGFLNTPPRELPF